MSDRFGDVAEALPMTQWFVDVNKKIPDSEKVSKNFHAMRLQSGMAKILRKKSP